MSSVGARSERLERRGISRIAHKPLDRHQMCELEEVIEGFARTSPETNRRSATCRQPTANEGEYERFCNSILKESAVANQLMVYHSGSFRQTVFKPTVAQICRLHPMRFIVILPLVLTSCSLPASSCSRCPKPSCLRPSHHRYQLVHSSSRVHNRCDFGSLCLESNEEDSNASLGAAWNQNRHYKSLSKARCRD